MCQNQMVMSIEQFFKRALIPAIHRLTPEEKAELRAAIRDQFDSKLRLTEDDERWLRQIKINPHR